MTKKIFISGGGTGGHIYPAVAIYEELQKFIEAENIFYIGNPKNLEKAVFSNYPIEFLNVYTEGMPRKLSFKIILWGLKLLYSILLSLFYILKHKPSAIIGTGGYVSAPILISGIMLGVPCFIHDSDAFPGVVSRKLAPFCKCVFLAFEEAKKRIKSTKIIINGNPLRNFETKKKKQEILENLQLNPNKSTILVIGGSQGAKTINNAIWGCAEEIIKEFDCQIIHQTGKTKFQETPENLKELNGYLVAPYFDNMPEIYQTADLVISRAGSISISEINNCGLPSILVPYPHAAANHQYFNAKAVEAKGAAILLEDKNCSCETLKKNIKKLLNNRQKLTEMGQKSHFLMKKNASKNLVKEILSFIKF